MDAKLSQLNDQLCNKTETHYLSYGRESVQKAFYALPARQVLHETETGTGR